MFFILGAKIISLNNQFDFKMSALSILKLRKSNYVHLQNMARESSFKIYNKLKTIDDTNQLSLPGYNSSLVTNIRYSALTSGNCSFTWRTNNS